MIDKTSESWKEVESWAKARIESIRLRLEDDQPELETAKLRGQIAILRELCKLQKPSNMASYVQTTEPSY